MIVSIVSDDRVIYSEYCDDLSRAVVKAENLERAIIANGFKNLAVRINKIN